MLSFIIGSGGLILIIWSKPISSALHRFQVSKFKMVVGKLINLDNPRILFFYRLWVVLAGILLLVGAFASYFGPLSF